MINLYILNVYVPWAEEVEQEEEWAHMWLVKVALWLPNVEVWSAEQLELSTDDSDISVDILTISVCCETSWDISLSSSISEMNWEHVIIDLDLLASIAATTSSILSTTRLSAVTILAFFSSVLKVDTTYMYLIMVWRYFNGTIIPEVDIVVVWIMMGETEVLMITKYW